MGDSLNPYASPQFTSAGPILDVQRTLTATFVIDSLWQRRVAGRLTPWQQQRIMLLIAIIFLGTCLVTTVAICSTTDYLDGTRIFIVAMLGLWLGAMLGLACVFPLMFIRYLLNWGFRPPQFPKGLCTLRIEADQLRLVTSEGEFVRPLEKSTYEPQSRRTWFFISSVDQVLLIERTADFGDDDYQSWCAALRGRFNSLKRQQSESFHDSAT